MTAVELTAIVLCLAAAMAYLNARVFRLPSAIGLMAISLVGSFIIIALDHVGLVDSSRVQSFFARVDFADVLMHGFLGLMLFAGALHVDMTDLATHKWPIAALALGGTVLSTAIVGVATFFLMRFVGHDIGFGNALLFGALISPTDPIAVLGILKSAKVPDELAVQISGESLFNDGIGVVLFLIIGAASTGDHLTLGGVALLFAREAIGGALFGFAIGYAAYRLLRSIDDYSVEVLITLALVVGGYAAAEHLHISAPISAVVAGLVVGNQGRRLGMSDLTRQHVDLFWKLVDEILNAVLFLLLGFQSTLLHWSSGVEVGAVLVVPVVLIARFLSVAAPVSLLRLRSKISRHTVKILTWGGLRGGISVALALSLPEDPAREAIFVLTFAVVVFSVLVQGLSLGYLLRRLGLS